MIETKDGYMAVFTKYDTIIERVNVPFIRDLEPSELSELYPMGYNYDQSGWMTNKEYHIKGIEDGLEGIKFVHYDIKDRIHTVITEDKGL